MEYPYAFQHPFWDFVEAVTNPGIRQQQQQDSRRRRIGNSHRDDASRRNASSDLVVSPLNDWDWSLGAWPTSGDASTEKVLSPAVDVYDTPESYKVVATVAGVSPDELDVDFDPYTGELRVTGETSYAYDKEDTPESASEYRKNYLKISERRYGKFERRIRVPKEPKVDEEGIVANIDNGVLKVTLPKVDAKAAKEKKKIKVTLSKEEDEEAATA